MAVEEDINVALQEAAKCYGIKDYESAVGYYSEANQKYEAIHGAPNADYLFLYGRSLYRNALAKSDVLGGGGDAATENEESEEKDEPGRNNDTETQIFQSGAEVDEEDEEQKQEGGQEVEQEDQEKKQEQEEARNEPEQTDDNEKEDAENEQDKNEDNEEDAAENNDEQDEEFPEEEEDQSDFEAAWEILELARSLYEEAFKASPEDKKLQEKLSETYDVLGEISLESENFQQAAEDFQVCLEYREKLYKDDDATHRLLIESHYKIFLALEFLTDSEKQCREHLTTCVELLQARIDAGKSESDDDLELLSELKHKLKEFDHKGANTLVNLKNDLLHQLATVATASGSSGKVNDLTSMVKKRPARDSQNDKRTEKKSKM
ncbi:HFR027Wp [Eremothecium sinecaudum]|uniref:HFR027Wp n=1 Tax=Eremothecium sinecaudum TaxID=45286 RepID=A0A0X8HUV5_9SACH|nr:HFR027Wp [Eremothecium sinecaudum]AMD21882.1 HFR027Wp [Eremothecium sinecaudum]